MSKPLKIKYAICAGRGRLPRLVWPLLLLAVLAFPAVASAWNAPLTLSAAAQPADNPQVAVDPNGNAVFTWARRDESGGCADGLGCYRTQARVRSAGGTLSGTQTLSAAGQGVGEPHVGVDQSGNAVFVWQHSTGTTCPNSIPCVNIQARARSATGTLSAIQTLSAAGQLASSPKVAVDQSGNAVFVWRRLDGTQGCSASGCYRIQARARSATGTLSPIQTLSDPGQNAFLPQVGVDQNGNAVIIWERGSGGPSVIQARARSATGTLSAVQTLSDSSQPAFGPHLAVGASGNAVFVWYRRDGTTDCGGLGCFRIQARFRSSTGTLSAVQTLSDPGRSASFADVAVDEAGEGIFTWTGLVVATDCCSRVQARAATPSGMTPIEILSAAGQSALAPHVGVDQSANAVFVWQRYDGTTGCGGGPPGCRRVQSRVWSPNGLEAVQTLSAAGQHADGSQVSVNQSGSAAAAWWRPDGTNTNRIQAAVGP
jgi:hypothetical protein